MNLTYCMQRSQLCVQKLILNDNNIDRNQAPSMRDLVSIHLVCKCYLSQILCKELEEDILILCQNCLKKYWLNSTTHCMFGCQPLYSCQSRLTLWLCDDRTDLLLHDDVGIIPETEGRRRITVLSLFGRALYGLSVVALTSDRSSSTLAIG